MKPFTNTFAAWTAIAVLSAASLFAAETSPGGGHRHGRHGAFLSSLNLTPAQQAQEKSIFQEARQSAQPLRQQLRQIRSTAMAKVYQILTPEQQQKLAELQQARRAGRRAPAAGAQN